KAEPAAAARELEGRPRLRSDGRGIDALPARCETPAARRRLRTCHLRMGRAGLKRARLTALICCALGVLPAWAQAQEYPHKPIRLVVPYAPGGSSDVLARALGPRLGELLGQAIVVDNKPGAGSMLGTDGVAKSAPDGHQLLPA